MGRIKESLDGEDDYKIRASEPVSHWGSRLWPASPGDAALMLGSPEASMTPSS